MLKKKVAAILRTKLAFLEFLQRKTKLCIKNKNKLVRSLKSKTITWFSGFLFADSLQHDFAIFHKCPQSAKPDSCTVMQTLVYYSFHNSPFSPVDSAGRPEVRSIPGRSFHRVKKSSTSWIDPAGSLEPGLDYKIPAGCFFPFRVFHPFSTPHPPVLFSD
ncbi:hypothetical protein TNCV_2471691 [Trichonephila clavipes]|nr:hypothetical protein TNCV_2471691 [Trichonephila clavipes]